jgi:nicotinamide phosphoribosyltransferase
MYLERYATVLNRLESMGYTASNLCIGIGGILRFHSRDTLGFAIKATKVEVNGVEKSIMKDPITDVGKKSHTGYLKLDINKNANTLEDRFITFDNVTRDEEKSGYLSTVFENGKVCCDFHIADIRNNVEYYANTYGTK